METTWYWSLLGPLSAPLLVAVNGFFVAADFALVAVRKTRVEEMVRHGQKGATRVASAVANLDRSIAATQLGITLANLALGWAGEPALAHLVEPMFGFLPVARMGTAAHSMALVIAFSLITFLHVVFGELMSKTVALQKPDGIALWVAAPLNVFAKVGWPLIRAMNGTGSHTTDSSIR